MGVGRTEYCIPANIWKSEFGTLSLLLELTPTPSSNADQSFPLHVNAVGSLDPENLRKRKIHSALKSALKSWMRQSYVQLGSIKLFISICRKKTWKNTDLF